MDKVGRHQPPKLLLILVGVNALDLQTALGQRAGFVQAHHVAVSKVFQRMKLSHQHIFLGQSDHAHRKTDADEQDQALGQHPQQACRGGDDRCVYGCATEEIRLYKQQHAQRHNQKAGKLCDLFHGGEQLGAAGLCAFYLVDHPGSEAFVRPAFRFGKASSGNDAAAGKEPVAGMLHNRLGFARQDGLVDLRSTLRHGAVGADSATRTQHQHITLSDLFRVDGLLHAAAEHGSGRLGKQRQALDLPFGLDLLHDANGGVDKNDKNEQDIFPCSDSRQRNGDHQIQRVKHGANIVAQDLRNRFCGVVHGNSP